MNKLELIGDLHQLSTGIDQEHVWPSRLENVLKIK